MKNDPLFHELYGNYYLTASKILAHACTHNGVTLDALSRIVEQMPFGGVKSEFDTHMTKDFFLLKKKDKRYMTPIRNVPKTPLSTLERRWLCAALRDPRVQLFLDGDPVLPPDTDPLFSDALFVFYDRYTDGDDYTDPQYRAHFRTILQAIRTHRYLHAEYRSADGGVRKTTVIPYRLEYSEKGDKFRVVTAGAPAQLMNVARFLDVREGDPVPEALWTEPVFETDTLVLELTDEHNALERVLLHFSDLRKETTQLSDGRYRVRLKYRRDDEAELLIRILSFGSVLKVCVPKRLVKRVEERLALQAMRFLPDA